MATPESNNLGFSRDAEKRQSAINQAVSDLIDQGLLREPPSAKVHGSLDDLAEMQAIVTGLLQETKGQSENTDASKPPRSSASS